jgi:ferredoxin
MCSTGGSWRVLKRYAELWGISTAHFDSGKARRQMGARYVARPLADVLVENSSYPRKDVKRRLFEEGLKERRCELCGQGETWRGKQMSLILDHINGRRDDHRLENLQIVCPNCAATLDTHCGRKNRISRAPRKCRRCQREFVPNSRTQRYCSRACGTRWDRTASRGIAKPEARKVERPPYEQLIAELEATSCVAVGRKYGVSDNAVRKWVRFYERECERERTSDRR